MANPTREQVEAYLATLPADQQGPALEEIKRRMSSETMPDGAGATLSKVEGIEVFHKGNVFLQK